MNKITLAGEIIGKPEFSHQICEENFYEFFLSTERTSGAKDIIKCIIPEPLLILLNDKITINGEVRTKNLHFEEKNKLDVYVIVNEVIDYIVDINDVELVGTICKKPTFRDTPLGRQISDLIIASNREIGFKSDYIPTITWGKNALLTSKLEVGTVLTLHGRLQSREYQKQVGDEECETRVAYELSVAKIKKIDKKEE